MGLGEIVDAERAQGEESVAARDVAHGILYGERRCHFGRNPGNVHGVVCNALTTAIETREAALRARIGELEWALRLCAVTTREPRRCGFCGWLIELCDNAGPSCRGVAARRALGTPKGETP